MSDICGLSTGWAANYTSFHRESLLKQSSNTKYLVAVPNLSGNNMITRKSISNRQDQIDNIGMADRVIGFVTVFMMSILTNRVFQLGNRLSLPIFEVSG